MAPRACLIAQVKLDDPNHSLADQPIVWVGPLGSQSTEPLRQRQSDAMPAAVKVKGPQAPERAKLVLGIVKAVGKLQRLCPCRADLGDGRTQGIGQRGAPCDLELHLATRIPARSGSESGERLLNPAAALP